MAVWVYYYTYDTCERLAIPYKRLEQAMIVASFIGRSLDEVTVRGVVGADGTTYTEHDVDAWERMHPEIVGKPLPRVLDHRIGVRNWQDMEWRITDVMPPVSFY